MARKMVAFFLRRSERPQFHGFLVSFDDDMHNLMLAKDVIEPRRGLAAIGDYMRQCGRYNAAYAIFRAQRSVMNTIGLPAEERTRA